MLGRPPENEALSSLKNPIFKCESQVSWYIPWTGIKSKENPPSSKTISKTTLLPAGSHKSSTLTLLGKQKAGESARKQSAFLIHIHTGLHYLQTFYFESRETKPVPKDTLMNPILKHTPQDRVTATRLQNKPHKDNTLRISTLQTFYEEFHYPDICLLDLSQLCL